MSETRVGEALRDLLIRHRLTPYSLARRLGTITPRMVQYLLDGECRLTARVALRLNEEFPEERTAYLWMAMSGNDELDKAAASAELAASAPPETPA